MSRVWGAEPSTLSAAAALAPAWGITVIGKGLGRALNLAMSRLGVMDLAD